MVDVNVTAKSYMIELVILNKITGEVTTDVYIVNKKADIDSIVYDLTYEDNDIEVLYKHQKAINYCRVINYKDNMTLEAYYDEAEYC